MSIRSNSLHSVIVDSVYFVGLMSLAAASLTDFAHSAEPSSVQRHDTLADRRFIDDHIDSQLNTDDNMPSGSQIESPQDKRQAMMLGMKLFEQIEGNIRVVDVAATSPAWDAGIRPGDRVLSIDGLKPQALSPWVEDLGKVLRDTPDGHAVSAEIERDGEKLALRIRLLVSKAAELRDARQEERALANMATGQNPTAMQPGQTYVQVVPGGTETGGYGPGNGGYGGYALGGWGIDSGFFGTEGGGTTSEDRMATNAVAQLMRVNIPTTTTNANSDVAGARGQVGLAAFRDNGQSVNAIVAVRGLPPGTYVVGITQGDGVTGVGAVGFGPGAIGGPGAVDGSGFTNDPRMQGQERDLNNRNRQSRNGQLTPEHERMRQQSQPGTSSDASGPVPNPANVPAPNNTPASGAVPGGGAAPSGGAPPTGVAPAGGATPTGTVPEGGNGAGGASLADPNGPAVLAQRIETPGSGIGLGGDSQQTNGSQQGTAPQHDNATTDTTPQTDEAVPTDRNTTDERDNNDFVSDPNNLVGPVGIDGTSMLANIGILRVGPDGSGRVENQLDGLAVRNLSGMSVTVTTAMSRGGNGISANQAFRNGAPAGQSTAAQGIVATGVIRLVDDGNVPNLGAERRGLFPDEERPVDRATQKQRRRSQISDPRQDFDPSTSE